MGHRKPKPPVAAPTRLYQVLMDAYLSPDWLAGQLRLPSSIVQSWCWNLDLPPDPVRERVHNAFRAQGLSADALWVPMDPNTLRPHLRLVSNDQDTTTSEQPEGKKMDLISREYLTQKELERFNVPVDATGQRPDPFDSSEDPEDIFRPDFIRALEAMIWETTQKRRIMVVTGEPGAGKSTLVRRVYGGARREKRVRFLSPGTLDRSKITHKTLAVTILRDLVAKDTSNMSQEARDELLRQTLAKQKGLHPVVFIDEAHLLPNRALLAIKHIWDAHTLFQQLAVVLVGHPALGARMGQDPDIREFTLRSRLVELPAYDSEITRAYLDWRFSRVNARAADIFSPAAIDILARRGKVPLTINALATRAMRAAAPTGCRVEAEHVGRV